MNIITLVNAIVVRKFAEEEVVSICEGKSGVKMASFRVSEPYYNRNAENSISYNTYTINAYGDVAKKVENLRLKKRDVLTITGMFTSEPFVGNGGKDKVSLKIRAYDVNFAPSHKKKDSSNEAAESDTSTEDVLPNETIDEPSQKDDKATATPKTPESNTCEPEVPFDGLFTVIEDGEGFFG